MIEVKRRQLGGGSNGRQLAIARPWCKGAEISNEDVTRLAHLGIRRDQGGLETDTAWHAVIGETRVVPVAALLFEGVNEGITESQGKDAVLVASASDLCQEVM